MIKILMGLNGVLIVCVLLVVVETFPLGKYLPLAPQNHVVTKVLEDGTVILQESPTAGEIRRTRDIPRKCNPQTLEKQALEFEKEVESKHLGIDIMDYSYLEGNACSRPDHKVTLQVIYQIPTESSEPPIDYK